MLKLRAVIGLWLAMSLAGCGALGTSENTVGPGGPAVPATGDNQFRLFETAYKAAYAAQNAAYSSGVEQSTDQNRYRLMASAGFSLVKANCSEFFRTRGESQKWFKVAADLVAVGGAVATGIMAAFGSTPVAVSIAALSTATAYSTIDVYSKNFLFGAENIESVRVLTMNALSDNAAAAYNAPGEWDFGYAATAVMSNQELCKPASILALTREAIKGGRVNSIESAGTATTQLDGALKQMIAEAAGMSRGLVPTDSQVVGLCWAADPGVFGAEDKTTIANLTSGLKYGPSTGSWPFVKDAVASQCGRLSSATRTAIQKQVEQLRPKPGTMAPASVPEAAPMVLSLPSGRSGGGTQRNITTFAR